MLVLVGESYKVQSVELNHQTSLLIIHSMKVLQPFEMTSLLIIHSMKVAI